jgi:hypothetical protein
MRSTVTQLHAHSAKLELASSGCRAGESCGPRRGVRAGSRVSAPTTCGEPGRFRKAAGRRGISIRIASRACRSRKSRPGNSGPAWLTRKHVMGARNTRWIESSQIGPGHSGRRLRLSLIPSHVTVVVTYHRSSRLIQGLLASQRLPDCRLISSKSPRIESSSVPKPAQSPDLRRSIARL